MDVTVWLIGALMIISPCVAAGCIYSYFHATARGLIIREEGASGKGTFFDEEEWEVFYYSLVTCLTFVFVCIFGITLEQHNLFTTENHLSTVGFVVALTVGFLVAVTGTRALVALILFVMRPRTFGKCWRHFSLLPAIGS